MPDLNATFVVAVNDDEILRANFLLSPFLRDHNAYPVRFQRGYRSAAAAYNDAIDRCNTHLIVFCHQDILFPAGWISKLAEALKHLKTHDENWGVLGCCGMTQRGGRRGYMYSSGIGIIGQPFITPEKVQTLDEIVLVIRRDSGLRFDEGLPHFHFYGTDICLRAAERGLNSYAINAFCIHNTQQPLVLPTEFYECYRYIKRMWGQSLPVQTTCIRLTRLGLPLYTRQVREFYLKHLRCKTIGGRRTEDATAILDLANRALTE